MEYSHCKANTINSNIANEASAILTHLQSNTRLIKCWNLYNTVQMITTIYSVSSTEFLLYIYWK